MLHNHRIDHTMAFSLMLRRTRPCIPRRTCKSTLGFNIMVHGIREIIPISSATSRSFFQGSNSRRLIRDSAIGTNNAIKPLTADFIASFDKMLFTAGTKNNDGADFSSALIDPDFVFSGIAKSHAFALHVPITFLHIALNRQYEFHQTNLGDAFEAKMINLNGTDWFTATFTHPITKEKFPSGIGQEINVEKRDDASLYIPIYQTAVKIVDGKVYYSGRKLAEHAAAARAIDCLTFREENAQQKLRKSSDIASAGTRLCLEDPYLSAEERESQQIDHETLLAQRKNYRKLKPFAFFAKAKAHLLHSPKTFLHDALSRVYGQMPSFNDGYQVQEVLKDGGRWYTGTFSHPATKEEFSSGICKEVDVEVKKSQCLRPPLHRSEVKVIGGKVYYDEPRLAEHAAAARAIDCLLLREDYDDERNGITRDETSKMYRLCLEDPYLNAKEQDSQQIDYDALVSRKNVKQQKIFTDFAKYQPFLLHRPKTLLHNALSKKYGPSGSSTFKDAFDVQAISDDSKWFTATFTHPISNEQFSSGIYKEISTDSWSKQQKQGCMLTPLHDHEVKFWDGKVYYKEPAIAEIAAAARAIDCMLFREKYDDERVGLPRDEAPYMVKLCLEDPYLSADERKSQIIDYDALMAQRRSSCTRETSCEVDAGNDYLHDNNPSLGDAGNVVLEAPTTSADSSNDLDYNDDDFIIQVISPSSELISGSSSPWKIDKQLSTMERIVEIWADTTEPEKADTTKMAIKPAKDPQSSFPLDVPVQEKIDSILAWYKRVDRRPQTYEQASALALVCNKILTALGNSNCSMDIVPVDIEKDAKGILDKIISLSLTFSGIGGESSFLDAETLNAYMYCLSRSDPSSSAESALGLLDSMVTNENFGGVALPSPNLGTYNAVMLLFSMVDGIDAQTGVNSVYSRLEVASLGRIDAQNLRPNKDTFKILLGSNSKKNNRFCVDTAKVSDI